VQLHGAEPPEAVDALRRAGLWVLKAIRVRGPESLNGLSAYRPDAFVLDAHVPGIAGGTGRQFDWALAREAVRSCGVPVVLAGGLREENVEEALRTVRPWGVDVSSGVERRPGEKDPLRVRAFVEKVRRYDVG
ncbi:MAG TPA: phosphoribosylanthranilate isomerase, partial [Limnochordia bacterium]